MTIEPNETGAVREAFAQYLRQRCSNFDELVEFAAERLADLANDIENYEQLLVCERQRAASAEAEAAVERAERQRLAEMVMPFIRHYQRVREHVSVTVPRIIDDIVNGIDLQVRSQADDVIRRERGVLSSKGGYKKHENSPQSAGKIFVEMCWRDWQSKPSMYASKAAFARDMLDKREELKSSQVIERWCRAWEQGPSGV